MLTLSGISAYLRWLLLVALTSLVWTSQIVSAVPSEESRGGSTKETTALSDESPTAAECDSLYNALEKSFHRGDNHAVISLSREWRSCTNGRNRTLSYLWDIRALYKTGQFAEVRSVAETLDADSLASDSTLHSYAFERVGRAAHRLGDGISALLQLKRAVHLSGGRSVSSRSNLQNTLALAALAVGEYARALHATDHGLHILGGAQTSADSVTVRIAGRLYETRAFVRMYRALETSADLNVERFLSDVQQAEAHFRKNNNRRHLVYIDVFRAGLSLHRGNLSAARHHLAAAHSEARSIPDPRAKAVALLMSARIELQSQNPSNALADLQETERIANEIETKSFAMWTRVLRVRARVQMNDRSRALAVYESLRTLEAPGATYGTQLAALSLGSLASSERTTTPWEVAAFLIAVAGLLALRFRRPSFVAATPTNGAAQLDLSPDPNSSPADPESASSLAPDPLDVDDAPVSAPDAAVQARHLAGTSSSGEAWSSSRNAPSVDMPSSIADTNALGDVVAVESADGTAVWARLFSGEVDAGADHHGPRLLVVRDGGGVELARAGGAIGIVIGETSRFPPTFNGPVTARPRAAERGATSSRPSVR